MRALIVIALLIAAPAFADDSKAAKAATKPPPTHISEQDAARVERARLLAENAELRRVLAVKAAQEAEIEARKAASEFESVANDIRTAYKMGPRDDVDPRTREIKREAGSTDPKKVSVNPTAAPPHERSRH
jgi:hypothetical protein